MPTAAHLVRLGWPDPSRGEAHVRQFLGRGGVGLRLPVHRDIVPLVDRLVYGLLTHGVPLTASRDDWGFAWRKIRGGTTWSMHAAGLAVDFDALTNPMGPRRTTFPVTQTRRLAEELGFRWGYDWANRPDAMHFEFVGSADDARALTFGLPIPPHDRTALEERRDAATAAEEDLMQLSDTDLDRLADRVADRVWNKRQTHHASGQVDQPPFAVLASALASSHANGKALQKR